MIADRVLGARYRLIRPLEVGGMGAVWLAEHLSLSSAVAVKLLAKEIAASEEGAQRFAREARTAASLRSPHVVQILDHGVDEGTPYIVMELLEGESLAERLKRVRRLSPAQTELVVRHVARAVGRAHDAGIVHRDLKPANIFIVANDEEELVKVLDFGIAKADADGAGVAGGTRTGTFLGTPGYVSPEQAEGASHLDYRTDIWSLGVVAFECLVGAPPFVAESFGSLVLAICSRPMPVPSERGRVPPGFDGWFARACARDPEGRFQSAREAANELRQLLELGEEGRSSAEPPPAGAREPSAPAAAAHVTTGDPSSSAVPQRREPPRSAWGIVAVGLGVLAIAIALLVPAFSGRGDRTLDGRAPARPEVLIQAVAAQPRAAASAPAPDPANAIVAPLLQPVQPAALEREKPGNAAPVRAAAAPTAKPPALRRRTPTGETPTAGVKAATEGRPLPASPPGQKPSSINLGLSPPARAD